jgi:ABC-type transport system involved in cytochrome c biogenesis permease subunit
MIDTGLVISVLLHLLPALYAVAFFDYLLAFVTEEALVRRLARPLLSLAVLANLAYFLAYTFFFEHIPMVTVYQVLGAVGFAVAATYLWVEARAETPHTGPFILGLVLVFQVMNTVFPKLDREVPEILQSTLFSVHVSAAVLGYSAFSLSAVYGLLYLLQYRAIRKKRFGLFYRRVPSLDILDRMNYYAAAIGFGFLTAAIVTGSLWSAEIFGEVQIDPKVLVAVITWVLYGVALLGRKFTSWQGPRMAFSSVLGFVIVLFSMFAVNFLFTKFHVFVS